MSEVLIRKDRLAGRITLNRPQALNALNRDMARAIDAALVAWRDDPEVALVIIDAEGERAFAPEATSPPSIVPHCRATTNWAGISFATNM